MKATRELKNEHEGIEIMLRVMAAVAGRLASGEQVQTTHLDGIVEFFGSAHETGKIVR